MIARNPLKDKERNFYIAIADSRYPDFKKLYPGISLDQLDDIQLIKLSNNFSLTEVVGRNYGQLDTPENKVRLNNPELFIDYPDFKFSDIQPFQLNYLADGGNLEEILGTPNRQLTNMELEDELIRNTDYSLIPISKSSLRQKRSTRGYNGNRTFDAGGVSQPNYGSLTTFNGIGSEGNH